MHDLFIYSISAFLGKHLKPNDVVVLALSGGPDSSALFEAVLNIQVSLPLNIHIAHVDHGWRRESQDEAALLEKKVRAQGIPFYQKTLKQDGSTSNLEDKARKERWDFFKEIYQELRAKALLLGHQKDDLIETVLKRLFEGAHLENLGGMDKQILIDDFLVLRPLLNIEKRTILEWLEKRNIDYFIDKTNSDLKFNRARLRQMLIPSLEEKFGKGIKENLYQLSHRAFRLREYLDRKVVHWQEGEVKGLLGSYYTLNGFLEKIEVEHFLLKIGKNKGIGLSLSECDHLTSALMSHKSIRVERKEGTWIVDRNRLFILMTSLTNLYWTCQRIESRENLIGWDHLWRKGMVIFSSPEFLNPVMISLRKGNLSDRYRRSKVPSFLRYIVPAFVSEKMDVLEVLSGRGVFEGGITYELKMQIGERQINEVLLK